MPSGGQIPAPPPGLKLQGTTPGTPDVGNADITGAMIAHEFNTRLIPNNLIFAPGLYGDYVCFGRDFTNARDPANIGGQSVHIGSIMTEGQPLWAGVGRNVSIGWKNFAYKDYGVCIGQSATTGRPDAAPQDGCIAIGNQAAAQEANNITIGQNATNNAVRGLLICSTGPNANINGTDVIAIGQVISGNRTNFLFIRSAAGTYFPTAADDNSILIGNPAQTKVTIGPYSITSGFSAPSFLQTVNVTVGNTLLETSLIGAGSGSVSIPANRLGIGSTVRVKARGFITDTLTPTLQFRLKLASSGTYIDLGAFALPAITGTQGWVFEGEITVRTTGGAGTAIGQGSLSIGGAAPSVYTASINNAAQAIATNLILAMDLTVQWGTANVLNTITCTNLSMEFVG